MKQVTLIKGELFKQGGLEKYTWQIAQDFCRLGCPVTLLTSGNVQSPLSDPLLQIVSFPIDHALSFLNVVHFDRACADYLKHHPTPIVFSLDRLHFQTHIRAGNGSHAAYLQMRAAQEGLAKKLSFALNPLHRAILSLEKKGFEDPRLKILFTNSRMVKQEILDHYWTDPGKIHVVHNGVEWHGLQEKFDVWEDQKQETYQFLFMGHNFKRKGLDKLLLALSEIKNEPFHLNIVGHDKGSAHFEHLAQRLNLSKKVTFFGPRIDAHTFYQKSDCLVIPSLYDPFANVTVEALAFGLFVLSSKTNGGHEVLTPESGALLECPDDPTSFAKALKMALGRRKTPQSALSIRQSVKYLDFSNQLRKITQLTLESVN